MIKRYLITGTDTDIGKTVAACALLQAADRAGYKALGYKPVASGCQFTDDGVRNSDALALIANSTIAIAYDIVNPLAFIEPTSPHLVSMDEGHTIEASSLSIGLRTIECYGEWIVIEGVGGWFTPLSETLLFSDWVIAEQLPVIMVVGIKLGCINHALLTAKAVSQSGLLLVGWIANHLTPSTHRPHDYLTTLKKYLGVPMLGEIPWLTTSPAKSALADFINFNSFLDIN